MYLLCLTPVPRTRDALGLSNKYQGYRCLLTGGLAFYEWGDPQSEILNLELLRSKTPPGYLPCGCRELVLETKAGPRGFETAQQSTVWPAGARYGKSRYFPRMVSSLKAKSFMTTLVTEHRRH